jgi:mitochondrial fission protein ELM1
LERLIWILSDGKAGHLSQTRGLAGALVARMGGRIREIDLAGKSFWGKLREIWKQRSEVRDQRSQDTKEGVPDFIIAAGHGTHLPLLLSGFLFKQAKTVVCMKPSFPMSWFGFSVVPRHDLTSDVLAKPPAHIIPTLGALHGVKPSPESPKAFTLILIGGPSKEYGWNEQQVIEQLKAVIRGPMSEGGGAGKFLLTTSRRTPAGFVDVLRRECPAIDVIPVEETPRGWVAEKLRRATAVWVTRDSVSMIYEALGSGAPVGLLNMPSLQSDGMKKSRVARGIEMLETDGWVTPFDVWKQTNVLKSRGALVEVDRVAEKLLID